MTYGEQFHIIALNRDIRSPITVTLVLKKTNQFFNDLEGIAVRPEGSYVDLPKILKGALRSKLGLWAAKVRYSRVLDPERDIPTLFEAMKSIWSESA